MIAKVSTGRSFGGTVRYLYEGHKNQQANKGAQLLDYNGIRPSMNEMIKDFDRHRWLNPDLGNAVGHISISYHQEDSRKATNEAMIRHARLFMEKMGINPEQTQWALIRHNDRSHQHFHLVYNRVDYNGKTISDAHNYRRSHQATRAIALEHGLTLVAEKKKDLESTNKANLPGHDQARYRVYEAIQKELPQATSIEELKQFLKTHHIEMIAQKGGKGISFRIGEHSVKASAVDRAYSGEKLHQLVEHNREEKLRQEKAKTVSVETFEALEAFMKKREQAQGFSELAAFMKKREATKDQNREQEINEEHKINKSQGRKL